MGSSRQSRRRQRAVARRGLVALVVVGGLSLAFWPVAGAAQVRAGTVPALLADKGPHQLAELLATDGNSGDQLGASVAVAGRTVAVGAPLHAVGDDPEQGAVDVYVRSGSSWALQAELSASDGAPFDAFGFSVALSGNTLAVGAPAHSVNGNAQQGAVYVFTRTGTTWTQTAELTASDGGSSDVFGYAVALAKKQLAVGAPLHSTDDVAYAGAVYVFSERRAMWTQQAELTASDGGSGDSFGASLALSGPTLAVGSPELGLVPGAGAVYVFNGAAAWAQVAELTAAGGRIGDALGSSVALSGDTLLAGAPDRNVDSTPFQGAAYVFTGGPSWAETAALTAPDGASGDDFGTSVALAGSTAVVGAPSHAGLRGAVYLFTGLSDWSYQTELTATDGVTGDLFGGSVAATPKLAAVGAAGRQDDVGAGYVFAA